MTFTLVLCRELWDVPSIRAMKARRSGGGRPSQCHGKNIHSKRRTAQASRSHANCIPLPAAAATAAGFEKEMDTEPPRYSMGGTCSHLRDVACKMAAPLPSTTSATTPGEGFMDELGAGGGGRGVPECIYTLERAGI